MPIEQIKVGDKDLSYDEKTKQFEYKTVAQTFIAVKENIVKIKILGEKLLTTTTEHPFYVKKTHKARDALSSDNEDEEGEWLTASELKVGQKVLRPDGKWTRITSITYSTEPKLVYNLEVEGNHNYFVGEIGVLSHNCNIFVNQLPGRLAGELADAARLGVKALKLGDDGFDAAINSGTVKWAVDGNGQLFIVPKFASDGTEIAHSVLTGGRPVLAAGEADIAGRSGNYFGIFINRHSGHFRPSEESLEIGRRAFASIGITFR